MYSIPTNSEWNFKDVKVFAADNFYPAADASYKDLQWENLPAPDILFYMSMDTPAIVSLDIENQYFIKLLLLLLNEISGRGSKPISPFHI